MPSTKVEKYIIAIHEEDYAQFAIKASDLLKIGWKHLNSGCSSIPIIIKKTGTTYTTTEVRTTYWMILTRKERVLIQ